MTALNAKFEPALLGDDLRKRGRFRQAEEDEPGSFDERDDDDVRQRERAERERDPEAAERGGAGGVGGEHDALAVPAIDQRACRQIEKHVGKRLREADDAGLGG
jgi:hypothetical protein